MARTATKGIVREKENYSTGIGGFYRLLLVPLPPAVWLGTPETNGTHFFNNLQETGW